MKKRFAIILTIIFACLASFALSGCGISRFYAYEYQNGVMMFLDGDETEFYAEFDFITNYPVNFAGVDAYLLNVLRAQYGDLIESQDENYYEETDASGNKTGRTIFYYYYARKITAADKEANPYRYDPKLIELTDYKREKGFYYNDYLVEYYNPLTYSGVDTPFANTLNAVLSGTYGYCFEGSYKAMLACDRRNKPLAGGVVKAADALYWAEFAHKEGDIPVEKTGYNFSYMVSWSWYLTVILITAAVIALILLVAKKRDGKIVEVKPKVVYRPYPYGYPPYGQNPYNYPNNQNPYGSQNPYGNPYNGQNNQNPYGNQYNNQQPPYGNYGNPQNPYGAPQYPQYPPQPPKPDDVFPGFGGPGEDEKK